MKLRELERYPVVNKFKLVKKFSLSPFYSFLSLLAKKVIDEFIGINNWHFVFGE